MHTSPSPLAEELSAQLSRRELGHLTVVRDAYDEENFGNAIVEFKADGVLLRFVRDRGPVNVDVGASGCFLSLDYLACQQKWTKPEALARHYARPQALPDFQANLPSEEPASAYDELLGALAVSDEAEAERIAAQLEAEHQLTRSPFSNAPAGPYFGVSVASCRYRSPKDALSALSDHWSEIVDAVADEPRLRRACNEETAFWNSLRTRAIPPLPIQHAHHQ